MQEPPVEDRLNEILLKLRERGYLRNPVERFVAGGGKRPGPVQLWGAAWRAWMVIGGLWSAWLSLALVEANSAYLAGFGDGLVLAAYVFLPCLFLTAVFLALVALATQLIGRRPLPEDGAARWRWTLGVAGGLVFGGLLVVLWLLDRTFAPSPAPVWLSVLFLAAAVGIGFLALRLVALVTGLYLGGSWKARRRLRFLLLMGGSIAALALLALLVNLGAGEGPPELGLADAPPVVVAAIDYLDPADINPAATPNLCTQRERSGVFTLRFPPASSPAEVWATLATGQPPGLHGVRELASLRLAGVRSPLQLRGVSLGLGGYLEAVWTALGLAERVPVSSRDWREPPIWDLITRSDGPNNRAAVFNWWATYPAVGRDGLFIFTDVAQQAVARDEEPPPGSVYPPVGEPFAFAGVPRLTLQLLNGRERARRLGAEEPPLEAVDRAFTGLLENWRGLVPDGRTPVEPVVLVVVRPESGDVGEVWISEGDVSAAPAGGKYDSLTLYEAAALLFGLCGLPLAEDLPGAGVLPPDWPRVSTYGSYSLEAVTLEELDPALENLRSLGYIQ
jgi:hypothetical protein